MAKYAISLGEISRLVILEAASAQQALDNVLVMIESQNIALIPRVDKKATWWFSRNTGDSSDEVVVKDTDKARQMVARLRDDVVDVFWFVSLQDGDDGHEHSIKTTARIKPSRSRS